MAIVAELPGIIGAAIVQLVWQRNGKLKVLDFTEARGKLLLAVALSLAAGLLVSFGATGKSVSSSLVDESELRAAQHRYGTAERKLAEQDTMLQAYAASLSRMKAHIIRLDAVGRRLTDMAGLDPADFSFENPPYQGGRSPIAPSPSPGFNSLGASLDTVSRNIHQRELQIAQLSTLLLNRQLTEQVRPDGHPVASGYISSFFGRRADPISGRSMMHKGVDYAGRSGSHIVAVADGVVAESRFYGGYGNFVAINHGQGYVTRYAHNKKNLVQAGERVTRGQVIALLGATGRATGPNLHFEVLREGSAVDPMAFINSKAR